MCKQNLKEYLSYVQENLNRDIKNFYYDKYRMIPPADIQIMSAEIIASMFIQSFDYRFQKGKKSFGKGTVDSIIPYNPNNSILETIYAEKHYTRKIFHFVSEYVNDISFPVYLNDSSYEEYLNIPNLPSNKSLSPRILFMSKYFKKNPPELMKQIYDGSFFNSTKTALYTALSTGYQEYEKHYYNIKRIYTKTTLSPEDKLEYIYCWVDLYRLETKFHLSLIPQIVEYMESKRIDTFPDKYTSLPWGRIALSFSGMPDGKDIILFDAYQILNYHKYIPPYFSLQDEIDLFFDIEGGFAITSDVVTIAEILLNRLTEYIISRKNSSLMSEVFEYFFEQTAKMTNKSQLFSDTEQVIDAIYCFCRNTYPIIESHSSSFFFKGTDGPNLQINEKKLELSLQVFKKIIPQYKEISFISDNIFPVTENPIKILTDRIECYYNQNGYDSCFSGLDNELLNKNRCNIINECIARLFVLSLGIASPNGISHTNNYQSVFPHNNHDDLADKQHRENDVKRIQNSEKHKRYGIVNSWKQQIPDIVNCNPPLASKREGRPYDIATAFVIQQPLTLLDEIIYGRFNAMSNSDIENAYKELEMRYSKMSVTKDTNLCKHSYIMHWIDFYRMEADFHLSLIPEIADYMLSHNIAEIDLERNYDIEDETIRNKLFEQNQEIMHRMIGYWLKIELQRSPVSAYQILSYEKYIPFVFANLEPLKKWDEKESTEEIKIRILENDIVSNFKYVAAQLFTPFFTYGYHEEEIYEFCKNSYPIIANHKKLDMNWSATKTYCVRNLIEVMLCPDELAGFYKK